MRQLESDCLADGMQHLLCRTTASELDDTTILHCLKCLYSVRDEPYFAGRRIDSFHFQWTNIPKKGA
jgi:hypothetical protein